MPIKFCKRIFNANKKVRYRSKGGNIDIGRNDNRKENVDFGYTRETKEIKENTFDPPLKENEDLPSYIQPTKSNENWNEEWKNEKYTENDRGQWKEKKYSRENEQKYSSLKNNFAYNVPYKFKVIIPEKRTSGNENVSENKIKEEYSRDVSDTLHYTDFCGFRNPTLSTFDNYRYWNDTGFKKFLNRIFPIKLPEHKKIDPLLREYIFFLHSFDPYRFSFKRLSERYYFSEKTISNIYKEESVKKFLSENELCDETTKRITRKEAILKIKELIYSQKIGYKQFGDFENAKLDEEDEFMGHKNTYDHINRQIIQVEALSSFPLPSRRDPVPKRVDVDMTVHNSANVKIMNWINPNDRVIF